MSRHLPYSKEMISRARAVNLVEFLESRGIELKEKGRSYCCLKEHDSLIIHRVTNEWFWNSRSIKGYNAIDFLMTYYHYSFLQAVAALIGEQYPHRITESAKKHISESVPKSEFVLPKSSDHMHRIYAYLTKTRSIDADIVTAFVKKKMLFEDTNHNAVFVGYDTHNRPAYGFARGTLTERNYKQDLPHSDKRFGFRYEGGSDTLFVFEAAIDMLSFITLYKKNWDKHNYVSLGGLSPLSMKTMLQYNPQIHNIVLCLDNDVPGIWKAIDYQEKNKSRYNVMIHRPHQKDWNNELRHQRYGVSFIQETSFRLGTNRTLRVYNNPDSLFEYLKLNKNSKDSLLLCDIGNQEKAVFKICSDFQSKTGQAIQSIICERRY